MFLKELDHGLAVRQRILDRMESAEMMRLAGQHDKVRKLLSIVVVGGGPTGVEFAAEMADFINYDVKRVFPHIADKLKVTLVEAAGAVLPMFETNIGEHVKRHLNSVGVDVRTGTMVKGVDSEVVHLKKGDEKEELDYGALVWVAGIMSRPITKELAGAFGQSNPRGIEVDEFMRVKGSNAGDVYAFGDCAVSGFPLTAQVAAQQGKYIGRTFRDEGSKAPAPFKYNHQGTMAYVGKGEAVAVLQTPPVPKLGNLKAQDFTFWRQLASCPDQWLKPEHQSGKTPKGFEINVFGLSGFAVWRGVYFTKLISYKNRFNVGMDWIRNFIFGRAVASAMQSSGR